MEQLFIILRTIHIVAGSLALLTGPVAMLNQNGGTLHRRAGNVYFYSMMVIVVSSIYMSFYKENWFLLMIAAFTFYLISTGVRALKLKKLHLGQKPEKIDWAILIISLISGLCLFIWGLVIVFVYKNTFGITAIVFGAIMLRGIYRNYKSFIVPPKEKNHWLLMHIGNMIGAYIATLTAFLVQNIHTNPAFIAWLIPTAIFLPILSFTINKFKKKSEKGQPLGLKITE